MKNLAFIDIEATEANAQCAEIIEIAFIVKNQEGELVDHFHSLVKPSKPIPQETIELTGIHNQMVANAPEFYEVASRVFEKLDNCILVAHKVEFDKGILSRYFKELDQDFSPKTICTLEMAKTLTPGLKSYSLFSLCAFFGIRINKHHRALDDAEALMELYRTLGLLSGSMKEENAYLPKHKKLIDKAPKAPGVLCFLQDSNKIKSKAVDNIQKELAFNFELKPKNKELISSCTNIQWRETGSLAKAMLELAKESPMPKWSIYTFKTEQGELIVRYGKTNPKKKAILYFHDKKKAIDTLNRIKSKLKTDKHFAYYEGPLKDKSEIVRRNTLIREEFRKLSPSLTNILIRSKKAINGSFQYVYVDDRERLVTFESEQLKNKLSKEELIELKPQKIRPSAKRALELSLKYVKNQKDKTEDVITVKRLS